MYVQHHHIYVCASSIKEGTLLFTVLLELLFIFFIFKFIYLYDLYIEEQGEEGNGTPGIIIYSSANITLNFQNNFTNKWREYG